MKICILGCSFTYGSETHDEKLFDDYWDMVKYQKQKYYCNNGHDIFYKPIEEMYNHDMTQYQKDCRQWSWVNRLRNDYEITEFVKGGNGIDYFQYHFNTDDSFKDHVLNSDLLIWQMTLEPRVHLAFEKESVFISSTCFEYVRFYLLENENNDEIKKIPEWKRKICTNYHEHIIEEKRFLNEKINFLMFILNLRKNKGKKSIVFQVYDSKLTEYINEKNEDLIQWIGFEDVGLVDMLVNEGKINKERSRCLFNHPSIESHKAIGEYFSSCLKYAY